MRQHYLVAFVHLAHHRRSLPGVIDIGGVPQVKITSALSSAPKVSNPEIRVWPPVERWPPATVCARRGVRWLFESR